MTFCVDSKCGPPSQCRRAGQQKWPDEHAGAINVNTVAPISPVRHAPDIVECGFDAAKHADTDNHEKNRAGGSQCAAAGILDEFMDIFGDVFLGFDSLAVL